MQKTTLSKALAVIVLASMLLAAMPISPAGAVTLTSIDPTSGPVGTEVRVVGVIDTLGGTYEIGFDIDDDGDAFEVGEIMVTASAPSNSYSVDKKFTVPSCIGSDAGEDHLVGLKDTATVGYKTTPFYVKTKRAISAPRKQEGDAVPINVTVTGGVATTTYNYTVGVTDPAGSTFKHYNFSFTSDANGAGTITRNYGTTFPTGAHTNYTGTYSMGANETAPGTITDAATGSFTIGLTNATEYRRFHTVNIKTAGWTPGQKLNITISDPTTVVKSWTLQTATDGTWTGDWEVPWNAALGTYTAEVKNATGSDKTVHSIQTFTVKSASLTVTITDQPSASYQRTQTATMKFTIMYPNGTYYNNVTHFSSITVSVYYNTTLVTSISLTAANFEAANKWKVSWKIPRDAVLGIGYNFTIAKESIVDVIDNKGPDPGVSSTSFTVQSAVLTVTITDQPSLSATYNRTETVTMKFNATYPDNSFYTDTDLGTITVCVWNGTGYPWNLTLAAGDFNSTTKKWTSSWTPPWNAPVQNYTFRILANKIKDGFDNKGPAATVESSPDRFHVYPVTLDVAAVNTDRTTYERGETVTVYFEAKYLDGSLVTTGSASITILKADGTSTSVTATYNSDNARFEAKYTIGYEALGEWTAKLAKNALDDTASPINEGPAADKTTTFKVTEAITLADVLAEIAELKARLDTLEATVDTLALKTDVDALKTDVGALSSAVDLLDAAVSDLASDLDTLSATAATTSDVDAVSSAVDAVKTDLAAVKTATSDLESSLAALSATAATTSDVDAVSSAVDAVKTDVAAIDTAISDLESTIDAVKTDLSGAIGTLNTYVIIALVLALIAAIAAIASIVLIYRKVAG